MVLAGDVGGTNARFAFFDLEGKTILHDEILPSRSFRSFEAAFATFRARAPKAEILATTIGIAGPVVDRRVKTTNLPWTIDARKISRRFELSRVSLVNDLVAVGLGAVHGSRKHRVSIFGGYPKTKGGNVAVIAAGTGLGEASLVWDGERHVASPSEGAHVDFAPRNAIERELLDVLARRYGHVSYERVASGSTMHDVYEFLVRRGRPEKKALARVVDEAEDRNRAVVSLARSGESEVAMDAIDLWCSVYGAEAGNLALKTFATAGVYVCGGVSAELVDVLEKGLPKRRDRGARSSSRSRDGRGAEPNPEPKSPFLRAFVDKGRMRPLLERIPVAVVLDPLAGLRGAGAHASAAARRR